MSGSHNRRDFLTNWSVPDLEPEKLVRVPPVVGDTIRLETQAMGCPWCVILNPGPTSEVEAASEAFAVAHQLESQLTIYRADSELMHLNRSVLFEEWFQVSPELFQLLQTCQQLHSDTDGAFDPVTRPLTALWRDCRKAGRIPAADEVVHALSWSGIQYAEFDAATSSIRFRLRGKGAPPLEIGFDLGAIGKGEGIDQVCAVLESRGVENYLVHGGYSSLKARGQHAGQSGWPVGLKNPLFNNKRLATLMVTNEGFSCSGSNVQFFRHEGQRYGHILDPRTGWPCDQLLSVTVLAPTAALADALSTAFYVMGLDKAAAYCDDHPEVAAILIPFPHKSRELSPALCNLSEERLYFEG